MIAVCDNTAGKELEGDNTFRQASTQSRLELLTLSIFLGIFILKNMIKKTWDTFLEDYCATKKSTLLLLIISALIFYFPVIYGQSFYADDIDRITTGSYGWPALGRFLAYLISLLYSANLSITVDPAPLTWILSIVIYGLAAFCINVKISTIDKNFALPLSLVFIVNPFFIENLLYRFDCLGMAFSLLLSALAFSLRWSAVDCVAKALLLIICLNFYQPFVNLFIGLVGLELTLILYKKYTIRYALRILYKFLFLFFIANLIYYLEFKVALSLFGHLGLLQPTDRGNLLPIEASSFIQITKNFLSAYNVFFRFWHFFLPYIAILIPFMIFSLYRLIADGHFRAVFGLAISLLFLIVSSVGLMAVLENQFLEPRGLSYFPVALMFVLVFLMFSNKNLKWLIFFPVLACLIFSYRVGNVQKLQRDFETPIFMALTQDLATLHNVKTINSVGKIKIAPFARNIVAHTPENAFLKRRSWITAGYIRMFGENRIKFLWQRSYESMYTEFKKLKILEGPVTINGQPFYNIYVNGQKAWVVWQ